MRKHYYNEFDAHAAQWLRNLIAAGHLPDGDVDERDIRDVRPSDLDGYVQCHFFAGIGGWPLALARAGWSADRPVWTGSCPCPPFSAAGKRQRCPECGCKDNICHPERTGYFICLYCGHSRWADDRHLWPEFARLIDQCRPARVFGEQVASSDGRLWLSVVRAKMERLAYGVVATDLCTAGVGAPHIRQRLWWCAGRLADADGGDAGPEREQRSGQQRQQPQDGGVGRLADADSAAGRQVAGSALGDEDAHGGARRDRIGQKGDNGPAGDGEDRRPGPTNGFWRDADWLFCRDGKWRPVEPGTFPLAHGVPGRVGQLRAYGNAIVPEAAARFIVASDEVMPLFDLL